MADERKKSEPQDSEKMARFKRVLSAIVAVPKDEAFAAHLKKNFSTPKRLMAGGKIGDVEPEAERRRSKPNRVPAKRKAAKRSRRS
jgi:hypothetical protein